MVLGTVLNTQIAKLPDSGNQLKKNNKVKSVGSVQGRLCRAPIKCVIRLRTTWVGWSLELQTKKRHTHRANGSEIKAWQTKCVFKQQQTVRQTMQQRNLNQMKDLRQMWDYASGQPWVLSKGFKMFKQANTRLQTYTYFCCCRHHGRKRASAMSKKPNGAFLIISPHGCSWCLA